jgi:hypothetical protein
MKTFLKVLACLCLLALLGVLVVACIGTSHFNLGFNGGPVHGAPRYIIASAGVVFGALAVLFALGVTVVALAGAGLMIFFSMVLCGLILLCVALPFLLPLAIPVVLVAAIVGMIRLAGGRKVA